MVVGVLFGGIGKECGMFGGGDCVFYCYKSHINSLLRYLPTIISLIFFNRKEYVNVTVPSPKHAASRDATVNLSGVDCVVNMADRRRVHHRRRGSVKGLRRRRWWWRISHQRGPVVV